MMHLKNHKRLNSFSISGSRFSPGRQLTPGFSFIEIMVAITLLAIFGTSLFLTQTSLFSRLLKTHTTFINLLETDQQLLKFNQQIQQAFQEKKSIDAVFLHHENKNPAYTMDIKIKPLQPSSKLFKDFGTNLAFIQATIVQEKQSETWWNFVYTVTPEDQAKKDNKPKEVAP